MGKKIVNVNNMAILKKVGNSIIKIIDQKEIDFEIEKEFGREAIISTGKNLYKICKNQDNNHFYNVSFDNAFYKKAKYHSLLKPYFK